MLKEPQKVGTVTPLWKSFEGYYAHYEKCLLQR